MRINWSSWILWLLGVVRVKHLLQKFSEKEIGDYFNAHFVCVQVDVDKEKELARKYQIRAMPTLVFMSAEGKDIVRVTGAASVNRLLKKRKEATGELPTFDELWASLKKNKKDVGIMQEILHEAPYIIQERRGQGWELV
ncbi:MAG: thioredoxin family protein [Butyricimonas faecihominis]